MFVINSLFESFSNYKFMSSSYNVALLLIFLMTVIYYFYFMRIRKQCRRDRSKEDIAKLTYAFHPEPLCDDIGNESVNKRNQNGKKTYHLVNDKVGMHLNVEGKLCLNFASSNFLNIMGDSEIEAKSIDIIRKYGVGSCGPRGFYGTVDVHLDLETRIADFMGMEEAIVYSYGFTTIASTIPAYCKQYDVIFCDIKISKPAKNGIIASRSKCFYFEHNNPRDLEAQIVNYLNSKKKVNKRERIFLVLEGIYGSTGNICNLEEMVKIRNKYQMRLFLDETNSIGVLGKSGRGILEHLNIKQSEVDLVIGSLETLLGSVGGFCVGSHFTIEHQRLSGLGYCFSASLPPVLTFTAISGFDYLDKHNPEIFKSIQTCSKQVHKALSNIPNMVIFGDELSPIKYLEFLNKFSKQHYEFFAKECRENGILVNLCSHSASNSTADGNSIKLCVNVALTPEDLQLTHDVLCTASAKVVENQIN